MLLPIMVLLVASQRLFELWFAGRNMRRLRERGAVEYGAGHFPFIVALHTLWLLALFFLVPWDTPPVWPFLIAYLALQPLRYWCLFSLGERWTTRVLVPPNEPRIRRGPYKYVPHPNYMIVALEIPLLPLAFGAWPLALVFGLANLVLLTIRITVEEKALSGAHGGVHHADSPT
jgi:methyltransferase